MFILFGFGKQTVKENGTTEIRYCHHCHNENPWQIRTIKTWFTLFFIPLIPYSSKHIAQCPICNRYVELEKGEFNQYVSGSSDGEIGNRKPPVDSMAGLNETQRNYRMQMQARKEREAEIRRENQNDD